MTSHTLTSEFYRQVRWRTAVCVSQKVSGTHCSRDCMWNGWTDCAVFGQESLTCCCIHCIYTSDGETMRQLNSVFKGIQWGHTALTTG